jgi:hypothetical protein
MWLPIKIPYICERLIGFSLPEGNQVAIVSYEGIHLLDLNHPEVLRHDFKHPEGSDVYDSTSGKLTFDGKTFSILGLYGGDPIRRNGSGDSIELRREDEVLRVLDAAGKLSLEFPFEDLSGAGE